MARTSPRRVTRFDRQEASRTAKKAEIGPAVRAMAVVAGVALLVYVAGLLVPPAVPFGGPLQGPVVGQASLTTIRKAGNGVVSLVIPVPWNAGVENVVLDGLVPIGPEGLQVKRAGVAPAGSVALESQRGFPPPGVTLLPVDGYTVVPGLGELDGFEIVVGLTGEGTIDGFALHYRAGGASYVAVLPDGALLCSGECQGRPEAEDAQRAQRASIARLAAFVEPADR